MTFNERVADIVTRVTGNMKFFWVALGFILFLRLAHVPPITEVLLDVENDLQLLLLAAAAVVSAKQQKHNDDMLQKIASLEEAILAPPALTLDRATLREMPNIEALKTHYLVKMTKAREPEEMRFYQGMVTVLNTIIDLPRKRQAAEDEHDRLQADVDEEEDDARRSGRPARYAGRSFRPDAGR